MTMADTPHCKDANHLQVRDLPAGTPVLPDGEMSATLVTDMACHNTPSPVPWGVLLSLPRKPGEGMHLLPGGARFLSWALVQHGEQEGENAVGIEHTFSGDFRLWKALSPTDAIRVGKAIAAIVQGQGG